MFFVRPPEQKDSTPFQPVVSNDYPEEYRFELSPAGEQAQRLVRLINQHPDIGIPYTPFALILDQYAGFHVNPGGSSIQPWWRLEPTPGDMEIARFLDSIYPETIIYRPGDEFIESRIMNNTPYGETFDILLSTVEADLLSLYPVAILLGDHALTPAFRQTLLRYLERGGHLIVSQRLGAQLGGDLHAFRDAGRVWIEEYGRDHLHARALMDRLALRYLPLQVEGDVQYTLNRTARGWVVGLLENKGAWKRPRGPMLYDENRTQDVTITLRGGTLRAAREWSEGQDLPVGNNTATVRVPRGDIRIVELIED